VDCPLKHFSAQALSAQNNESILLDDSPEAIVAQIEWVLAHSELAAKIGENGKAYIQSNYSWTTQNELLSALLQS
jgi:glycosyltransferase involved in cell wall biosynthesis